VGGDLGYEHRIGNQGVFGVNVFYRKVEDLVEIYNTGGYSEAYCEEWEEDNEDELDNDPALSCDNPGTTTTEFEPDSFLLSARNTGDGEVYGIEFDLSTPLDFVGMPDTGVFLNYFIQDLPSLEAAFGVTYRKQGDAFGRIVGEEVTTSYGEDLEIFVEKTFGDNFTIRAVGSNLLNMSKDEVFNKFNTLADQLDRDFDEYELETEEAGPVFQVIGRYSF